VEEWVGRSTFKDGERVGRKEYFYYKSGQIKREVNFKDGERVGRKEYFYYKSGQIKREVNFKDGKQHGPTKEYYQNGGTKYIETYKNGQKTSLKYYDRKGNIGFEQDFTTK
jgi:antitoxin component YwqK of YwqJK toxin-antitoxin module